jgi:hypothetical protein
MGEARRWKEVGAVLRYRRPHVYRALLALAERAAIDENIASGVCDVDTERSTGIATSYERPDRTGLSRSPRARRLRARSRRR